MPVLSRRALVFIASAFFVVNCVSLLAHDDPQKPHYPPEGFPNFYYDPADVNVEANVLDEALWYDGDILATDSGLCYAWLEFTPGEGDTVWVGLRKEGEWVHREPVTDVATGYAHPTLTPAADGKLWLTYEFNNEGQWDIAAVLLEEGKPVGNARRVSPGEGADINHDVITDAEGGLWVVWQSDRDGQFEIQLRHVTAQRMGSPQYISGHIDGDWHPAIAMQPDGTLLVVWDGYNGIDYDVYFRACRAGTWKPTATIAGSTAFEGRAEIVVDPTGRAWIAWEEGGENWGGVYRGISTTLITDEVGSLHRFRRIRLAVLTPAGKLGLLPESLPMPSRRWAELRKGPESGAKRHVGAFYERSALAVDESGRLWIAYRHYYTPWLGYHHRTHIENGWGVYARCFGEDGWSRLYRFDVDQRDGLQRLEITPRGKGIALVYTTGRTDRRKDDRPRGLVTAVVETGDVGTGGTPVAPDSDAPDSEAPGGAKQLNLKEIGSYPPPPKVSADSNALMTRTTRFVGGEEYQLYFGDLHRHTDLSLCRVAIDGTIDDAYRYAIDPGGLDFLGVTDHARDISRGQWLSHLWWRCQKEVLRHELGDDFFPLYAYERSGGTADHNIISLRNDRLRSYKIARPKFWSMLGPDTFVIPHQPFRRGMWKYHQDPLRRLAEIYQGCRDNVIAKDIHVGLDKGNHVGFIASSDHTSTSAGYACVWAPEPSRESIFRSLQERRTYGATDKIRLAFQAGDHWMGEIFTASEVPPLKLSVTGTAPIETVVLMVDGRSFKTTHPNRVKINIEDDVELSGTHYIYYHIVQSDGNQAWSSPVWVTVGDGGE